MREIKFRCWDMLDSKMNGPYTLEDIQSEQPFHFSSCDFAIMQYTGLKDKNGKEIYEGDILKTIYKNPYEVYFNNGGFRLRKNPFPETFTYLFDNKCDVEVIGNIYENPELVKV